LPVAVDGAYLAARQRNCPGEDSPYPSYMQKYVSASLKMDAT